jgi:hypothetical protein
MTDAPEKGWFDPEDPPEDFVIQDMKALEFMAYPNLARKLLYEAGLIEWPDLPELANLWLTELADVGLLELDPNQKAPLKQADHRRPTVDPREGKLYPARVEGHRQMFWIQVDARPPYSVKREYKPIKVLDRPLWTQTAFVSLLTILEANQKNIRKLQETLSEGGSSIKGASLTDMLRYVLSLLRYYRPNFEELSDEEQLGLVEETCKRINRLLMASRQLMEYLEYGAPGRDLRVAIENANRDVNAAVLKDVEGLSSSNIAKRLGSSTSEKARKKYKEKGGHRTADKMVERGKGLLEDALGEDGWRKQVEAMKADREWFRGLSAEQQRIYSQLDRDRISEEEARRYVARFS